MESKINLKIKKVNIKMEEAFPELKKEIDLYLLLSRNDENDFDSLVSKKDEFREKLFKKFEYCIYSERLEILEINFFRNASKLINDKEFDKLLKKYEYLISLISSIINFRKINEED